MAAGSEEFFLQLGLDASDLLSQLPAVNKLLDDTQREFKELKSAAVSFNSAGDILRSTFKGISTSGKVLETTIKNIGVRADGTTTTIRELTRSLREQAIAQLGVNNASRFKAATGTALDAELGARAGVRGAAEDALKVSVANRISLNAAITANETAKAVVIEAVANREIAAINKAEDALKIAVANRKSLNAAIAANESAKAKALAATANLEVIAINKAEDALKIAVANRKSLNAAIAANEVARAKATEAAIDREIRAFQRSIQAQQQRQAIAASIFQSRRSDEAANTRATQTLTKNLKQTNAEATRLTITWRSVLRLFAVQLAHQSVALLTRRLRESVQEAVKLSIAVAEIQTISQEASITTTQWTSGLRDLSDSFGLDILDQAEGAYETLSNQIAEGGDALVFLATANRLAIAAVGSVEDSVNVLSSVINSYKKDVGEAEQISAQLFKAVDLGRFRLEDIANSMGRVLVPAKQLGVTFEEVAASLSLMTRRGVPANEAMTFIRNILLKLIKPSKEMKELFRDIGVESGDSAIELFKFGGFMQLVEDRTKGSSTEIAKLFTRLRAITGATIFAGDGLQDFNRDLLAIQQSGPKFNKAVDIVLESMGKKFEIELTKIQNFFTVEFGQTVIEVANNAGETFGGFSNVIKGLAVTLKQVLLPAIPAIGIAFAVWLGPLGAVAVALGSILTVFNILKAEAEDEARQFKIQQRIKTTAALSSIDKITKETVDALKERNRVQEALVGKGLSLIGQESKAILTDIGILDIAIKQSIEDSTKAISSSLKTAEKSLARTTKDLQDAQQSIKTFAQQKFDLNLQFDLDIATPIAQVAVLQDRIEKLSRLRTDLIQDENFESVRQITKKILDLTLDQKKIQDTLGKDNEKRSEKRLKAERDIAKIVRDFSLAEEGRRGQAVTAKTQKEAAKSRQKANDDLVKLQVILQKNQEIQFTALDLRRTTNKLLDEQIRLEKTIAAERTKQQKDQADALVAQKLGFVELEAANAEFGRFKIDDALGLDTLVAVDRSLKDRADSAARLVAIQKELGVDEQTRFRTSERAQRDLELLANRRQAIEVGISKSARKDLQERQVEAIKLLGTEAKIALARGTVRSQRALEAVEFEVGALGFSFDAPGVEALKADLQEILKTSKDFGITAENFKRITKEGKLSEKVINDFLSIIERLRTETGGRLERGFLTLPPETRIAILEAGTALRQLRDNQLKTQEEALKNLDDTSKALGLTNIELLNATDATSKGVKSLADQLKAAQQVLREEAKFTRIEIDLQTAAIKANKEAAEALAKVRAASVARAFFDAPEFFASGGLARGTDSIPAMLSPGEFVVNSRSTKKFFSQLVAINSGVQGFASGGPVTNVGDINITAQGTGNKAMDVVNLGRQLSREIRRRRVKL